MFVFQWTIANYFDRYRHGETISTGFVESAINQVVSKRMVKKQQMRWTLCCTNYAFTPTLIFPPPPNKVHAWIDMLTVAQPYFSASRFSWGRDPSRRFPISASETPHSL